MPSTIIGLEAESTQTGINYAYEPEIIAITGKDGITALSFNVIGKISAVINEFTIGEDILANVPNMPGGKFIVVNRNLAHVAGGTGGVYRLSVSAEGGTENQSFISETSYTYATMDVDGVVILPGGTQQNQVRYRLEWLYPSVTITTNSANPDANKASQRAKGIVASLDIQIIKDKPATVSGPSINKGVVAITGSSIEEAGGLYRIRATASKGLTTV